MRRKQIALLGTIIAMMGLMASSDENSAERQVIRLQNQWYEAERAHNTEFIQQHMTDDFVIGTSQGDVLNKTQILSRLSSLDHKIDELSTDHIQVRFYGDVAILTNQTTIRGTDKGRPFGGEFRYVRIWVKQNGEWQAVLVQATPIFGLDAKQK